MLDSTDQRSQSSPDQPLLFLTKDLCSSSSLRTVGYKEETHQTPSVYLRHHMDEEVRSLSSPVIKTSWRVDHYRPKLGGLFLRFSGRLRRNKGSGLDSWRGEWRAISLMHSVELITCSACCIITRVVTCLLLCWYVVGMLHATYRLTNLLGLICPHSGFLLMHGVCPPPPPPHIVYFCVCTLLFIEGWFPKQLTIMDTRAVSTNG